MMKAKLDNEVNSDNMTLPGFLLILGLATTLAKLIKNNLTQIRKAELKLDNEVKK